MYFLNRSIIKIFIEVSEKVFFLVYDQKNLFPVCNCSPHGSVRSDCEQMSGKCICKPGISGDKCDTCPDGTSVTLKGCEGCKL